MSHKAAIRARDSKNLKSGLNESGMNPPVNRGLSRPWSSTTSDIRRFYGDLTRLPSRTETDTVSQMSPSACPLSPRTCPFGGACDSCPVRVQAKLAISDPDDEYEREADEIADQVMRMGDDTSTIESGMKPPQSIIQRECVDCDEEQPKEETP